MKDQNQLALLATQLKGELYYSDEASHQTMLLAYSTDASVYQEKPLAVAIPSDINDIKNLIDFARANQTTLIPVPLEHRWQDRLSEMVSLWIYPVILTVSWN
ncbi:hypothetical protein [Sphingobacterium sp. E70]|uniref:hypothetical protein n=1 Tax=Sphingobacterium sp. E70 TaxID=2853439 RepID=UPI002795A748|nr:hypothetical protein [Sphingobacterium sp. E70]